MEASRCAYKRNITLNSVRLHNYFITQGLLKGRIMNNFWEYRIMNSRKLNLSSDIQASG